MSTLNKDNSNIHKRLIKLRNLKIGLGLYRNLEETIIDVKRYCHQ